VSQSPEFKGLCDKGLNPVALLGYCVRFHAFAAVEELGSYRPELKRAFNPDFHFLSELCEPDELFRVKVLGCSATIWLCIFSMHRAMISIYAQYPG
jgi:hypothetical protein